MHSDDADFVEWLSSQQQQKNIELIDSNVYMSKNSCIIVGGLGLENPLPTQERYMPKKTRRPRSGVLRGLCDSLGI